MRQHLVDLFRVDERVSVPYAARIALRVDSTLRQHEPPLNLREEVVHGVKAGIVVEPFQMIDVIVAHVRQIRDGLLRLAHVGERVLDPPVDT